MTDWMQRATRHRPARTVAWGVGLVLVVTALLARIRVGEPGWIDVLAQSGALLVAVGVAAEIVARTSAAVAYRTAITLAIGSVVLMGWVNGAVGIIGSENNRANLMYGGVALVGLIGAAIARLRPGGMARALVATAGAQGLVALVALVGRLGGAATGPFEILTTNGFFVTLFLASAILFQRAAVAEERVAA